LHPGNAFSFVLTWLLTRHHKGRLLLRIDDIDADRKRPAYVNDIFDNLHWLGLDWDTGPKNAGDFELCFSQLKESRRYVQILEELWKTGALYVCNCSRSQIQATSVTGLYSGTCRHRNLPPDTPDAAWRVHVPENTIMAIPEYNGTVRHVQLAREMGDFVVRRRNGLPAYQIASLTDDLCYRTNLIVRGVDLLPSTAAQLFLARLLPPNAFGEVIFYHHPLLRDPNGLKLSKSAGSLSLQALRQKWQSPTPLYRALAEVLQIKPARVNNAADLLAAFSPLHLPTDEATLTGLW
jgi:glutamyl-tRNA synthetase